MRSAEDESVADPVARQNFYNLIKEPNASYKMYRVAVNAMFGTPQSQLVKAVDFGAKLSEIRSNPPIWVVLMISRGRASGIVSCGSKILASRSFHRYDLAMQLKIRFPVQPLAQ